MFQASSFKLSKYFKKKKFQTQQWLTLPPSPFTLTQVFLLLSLSPQRTVEEITLFSSFQNSKILQDSPSHQTFKHMYEILNAVK